MIDNNIISRNTIYDYARDYEERGFKLLKITPRQKYPAGTWIHGTEAHANAEFYKNDNNNYGIGHGNQPCPLSSCCLSCRMREQSA